jgi:hypothetical protein
MKLLVLIMVLTVAACQNGQDQNPLAIKAANDTANYTTAEWLNLTKDVGSLTFGEKAQISYHLRNIGDKPLFVVSAQPGCGCTIANYSKGAIAPGSEGVITAEFDSRKGSVGTFSKTIVVTTNTKGSTNTTLIFKGEIKKEGEEGTRTAVPVSLDSGYLKRRIEKPFQKLKQKNKI